MAAPPKNYAQKLGNPSSGFLEFAGSLPIGSGYLTVDSNGNIDSTEGLFSNVIGSLNGLTDETQTFAIGTTAQSNNIGWVSSSGVHTLHIPDASATDRGVVTTGTQTFAGVKTFSGTNTVVSKLTISGISNTVIDTSSAECYLTAPGGVIQLQGGGGFLNISAATGMLRWYYGGGFTTTFGSPSANIIEQRNSTNAQTFSVANTYTSSTNFEYGRFKWETDEFRIGTAVGSAGGVSRLLSIGYWNSSSTWKSMISWDANDFVTIPQSILKVGTNTGAANTYIGNSQLIQLTDGAGFSIASNGYVSPGSSSAVTSYTTRTGYGNTSRTASIFNMFHGTTDSGSYWELRRAAASSTSSTRIFYLDFGGNLSLSQQVATTGSPTFFTLTGAAHTTLTASTEATDIDFNLARTVQFAAGALTTQRAFRIQAPTYAFVSASTIAEASTFAISGPPAAGTNATITNAYAGNIESGIFRVAEELMLTRDNSLAAALRFSYTTNGGCIYNNSTRAILFNASGITFTQHTYIDSPVSLFVQGTSTFNNGSFASTGFNWIGWSGAGIGWSSSGSVSTASTIETALYRGAADVISQYRSTNAQTFRIYNTRTDASNYERARLGWDTNVFVIGTQKLGTGVARGLAIQTDGTDRMTFGSSDSVILNTIIRHSSEITSTPSGTAQTITLNNGNHQTLSLASSTGDVTVTLTVPSSSAAGTLIIGQHGATPRDITWAASSGTIYWLGIEPIWNSQSTSEKTIVEWRFDGTDTYLSTMSSPPNYVEATEYDYDGTYTYFGSEATDWRINRYTSAGVKTTANESNNGSYSSLSLAWPDRAILTYT